MKVAILLLIVGVGLASAKYLPYEFEDSNGVLLRNRRSASEESDSSLEQSSNVESGDEESSAETKLKELEIKQREKEEKERKKALEREEKEKRKEEEQQKKLEEKRLKQEQKERLRKEKEELKQQAKLEKERLKLEQQKKKLEEKLLKAENKRKEKLLNELKKEASKPQAEEDTFLDTEEENSVELEDLWRRHIYTKYGLSFESTTAEKQAALNQYVKEELGLEPNSTTSERRQAILNLIQNKLQSDIAEQEAIRNLILNNVNAASLQKIHDDIEIDIEDINNKTKLLENVTLPWALPMQQNLEEKRTLLQGISQFLANIIPNWISNNQQPTQKPVGSTNDQDIETINSNTNSPVSPGNGEATNNEVPSETNEPSINGIENSNANDLSLNPNYNGNEQGTSENNEQASGSNVSGGAIQDTLVGVDTTQESSSATEGPNNENVSPSLPQESPETPVDEQTISNVNGEIVNPEAINNNDSLTSTTNGESTTADNANQESDPASTGFSNSNDIVGGVSNPEGSDKTNTENTLEGSVNTQQDVNIPYSENTESSLTNNKPTASGGSVSGASNTDQSLIESVVVNDGGENAHTLIENIPNDIATGTEVNTNIVQAGSVSQENNTAETADESSQGQSETTSESSITVSSNIDSAVSGGPTNSQYGDSLLESEKDNGESNTPGSDNAASVNKEGINANENISGSPNNGEQSEVVTNIDASNDSLVLTTTSDDLANPIYSTIPPALENQTGENQDTLLLSENPLNQVNGESLSAVPVDGASASVGNKDTASVTDSSNPANPNLPSEVPSENSNIDKPSASSPESGNESSVSQVSQLTGTVTQSSPNDNTFAPEQNIDVTEVNIFVDSVTESIFVNKTENNVKPNEEAPESANASNVDANKTPDANADKNATDDSNKHTSLTSENTTEDETTAITTEIEETSTSASTDVANEQETITNSQIPLVESNVNTVLGDTSTNTLVTSAPEPNEAVTGNYNLGNTESEAVADIVTETSADIVQPAQNENPEEKNTDTPIEGTTQSAVENGFTVILEPGATVVDVVAQ